MGFVNCKDVKGNEFILNTNYVVLLEPEGTQQKAFRVEIQSKQARTVDENTYRKILKEALRNDD